jgi:hypothetical protein
MDKINPWGMVDIGEDSIFPSLFIKLFGHDSHDIFTHITEVGLHAEDIVTIVIILAVK